MPGGAVCPNPNFYLFSQAIHLELLQGLHNLVLLPRDDWDIVDMFYFPGGGFH